MSLWALALMAERSVANHLGSFSELQAAGGPYSLTACDFFSFVAALFAPRFLLRFPD